MTHGTYVNKCFLMGAKRKYNSLGKQDCKKCVTNGFINVICASYQRKLLLKIELRKNNYG